MTKHFRYIRLAVVLTVWTAAFAVGLSAESSTLISFRGNLGTDRVEMYKKAGDVKTGSWGGRGISLVVGKHSSKVELDCSNGKISSRIRIRKDGKFAATGTLSRTGPGPIRLDDPPKPHSVRFEGTVTGRQMRLTITYVDSGDVVGTFKLRQGTRGQLVRCK